MAWSAQTVVTATVITSAWGNQVRDNFNLTAAGVVTTAGDVVYATAANVLARLAKTNYALLKWTAAGTALEGGQRLGKGADVTSAATITMADGHFAHVTAGGVTQIDFITTTGWPSGGILILVFDGVMTVRNEVGSPPANTANIRLSAGGTFTTAAKSMLMLIYDAATPVWREVARTAT